MKYRYFVSYVHGQYSLGFGNMQVDRDEPFTDIKQIQALSRELESENIATNVCILNVVLLEDDSAVNGLVFA